MRLLTIGILAIGVATAGCDRTTAAASSAPVTNLAATDATSDPITAVASSGRARSVREVTIPSGTRLPIVLDTTVGSATSQVEQSVQAHLARPIVVQGLTVLDKGSRVSGFVTDATRSGKVKGRAHVAIRFETVTPYGDDERYRIETATISRTAPGTKKKDAVEIGAPAAGGALIGGLVGGKKGALIGTAAGGGAGTAVVLSTRGKEVSLPRGTALTLQLSEPLTIKVRS
jgi:hypothetical protein